MRLLKSNGILKISAERMMEFATIIMKFLNRSIEGITVF